MAKTTKYGITSLKADFPTNNECLDLIFDTLHTRECSCGGIYKRVSGRKQYQCSKCRFQIAPTAGTIFHKSDTPLTLWFAAILAFSNAKSGVSAKYMERELEVTYKTAWRILMLIRKALKQVGDHLQGDVEMDTAYFGGKGEGGRYNVNQSAVMKKKGIVMGAIERGGNARLEVVENAGAATHGRFLSKHVNPRGTRLMTDKTNALNKVAMGYWRHSVDHHRGEFVRGDVYVNNVDAFWSNLKRSITGTHKVISRKYLQEYLDGFVFLYNNRHNDRERFLALIQIVLRAAR